MGLRVLSMIKNAPTAKKGEAMTPLMNAKAIIARPPPAIWLRGRDIRPSGCHH
jgi:hypothetical protein